MQPRRSIIAQYPSRGEISRTKEKYMEQMKHYSGYIVSATEFQNIEGINVEHGWVVEIFI